MKYRHPSFFIFKFDSDRIHEYNYKINQTFSQGQKNGEIIRMADSEVLRVLRRLKDINFSQRELYDLLKMKQRILKEQSSDENKDILADIQEKIEKILFVPELVSVCYKNKKHYEHVYKKGLFINGNEFVRLFSGSGNIRKNTIIYINKNYYNQTDEILSNDRNRNTPIIASKLNAYYGMFGSSSTVIDFPKFIVVPDYKFEKTFLADKVTGFDSEIQVKRENITSTINAFDGMGLISPSFMKKIANRLSLDYLPSWAILRGPYIKGCIATFDISEFSKIVAQKTLIVDVWGNKQNVSDIDMLLSESQFKLWFSYKNCESYVSACLKNQLNFGVTRVSPNSKEEKDYVFSNYQFNQVLKLEDDQLEKFCQPTVEYFKNILSGDASKMAMYILGAKKDEKKTFTDWFDNIQNNIGKALMIDKNVKNDDFVYNYFLRFLNKQIKMSYLGKTVHGGNFQCLLSDMYAFCQHAFGLTVVGLLSEGKSYCRYWNRKGINKVISARSPLTHFSELNQLDLENNQNLNHWFKYVESGIILNHSDIDCYLYADSDFDGDASCSISQKEFIKGNQSDRVPITYDKKNPSKRIISDDLIFKADINSMNSEIGRITNISSTFHCMISDYGKNTLEYKELQKRLTSMRAYQGKAIDAGKGEITDPMPDFWTNYQKQNLNLSSDEQDKVRFMNNLVAKKRPEFFKFLYSHYRSRHDREIKNIDDYCLVNFRCLYSELLKKEDKTELEIKTISDFKRKSYFIDNNSTMNRISKYMQNQIKEIKFITRNKIFDYSIYLNGYSENNQKQLKISELYKEYCASKKAIKQNNFFDKESFSNVDQLYSYLRKKAICEIDSNIQNLASYAVHFCYGQNKLKEFCWDIFGNGIVLNLLENKNYTLEALVSNEDGDIEYLFKKYSKEKFKIDGEKEEDETTY